MKKASALLSLAGLLFFFNSCSWEIPETVSVKTNASYNFSFGNFEKNLDSELNIQSMLSIDKEGVSVYDYYPQKKDSKIQQFLITMKIYEKSLADIFGDNTSLNSFLQYCPDDFTIDLNNLPGGLPPLAASGTETFDFNPAEIMSSIKDALGNDFAAVELCSVPVYIYCSAGNGLSADAKLKMFYGDSAKNSISPVYDTYIAGSATERKNLSGTTLPELETDTRTSAVITDLAIENSSLNQDLALFMNNAKNVPRSDAKVCIDYDFLLKGELTKGQFVSENPKLVVYAAIVLPVKFTVTNNITLDIRQFIDSSNSSNQRTDIFGRSGPTEFRDMMKYIDAIRSTSLIYSTSAMPFKAEPGIIFSVDILGNNDYREYELDGGIVTFNYDDIHNMINTYPLCPNLKIKILKDAVFSVPRTKEFKMNLAVNIITDGTIQLF